MVYMHILIFFWQIEEEALDLRNKYKIAKNQDKDNHQNNIVYTMIDHT